MRTLDNRPPVLFYQSVWAMGLSGDEVLLFCTLSPILLIGAPVRRLLVRYPAIHNLATVVGILAYRIDDEGEKRLRTLAASIAISTMGMSAGWWQAARIRGEGEIDRHAK
jgi:hypothetical protein